MIICVLEVIYAYSTRSAETAHDAELRVQVGKRSTSELLLLLESGWETPARTHLGLSCPSRLFPTPRHSAAEGDRPAPTLTSENSSLDEQAWGPQRSVQREKSGRGFATSHPPVLAAAHGTPEQLEAREPS